jgi:hypothetical protein
MKGDHSLYMVILSREMEPLDDAPKPPVRYRYSNIIINFSFGTSNMKPNASHYFTSQWVIRDK